MKRIVNVILLILCMFAFENSIVKADWNFDPKLKLNSGKDFSKLKMTRDYNEALKFHKRRANSLIGASIDFQVGYNSTNANADGVGPNSVSATTKSGFGVGAILNVNLLNILSFSTGLDFSKKNFGLSVPYVIPPPGNIIDSANYDLTNNYINIPMNVNFGGMVSDKVGVTFSGGPYFGILLNASNALTGFKNFDLGLNGILTGKYYLNKFVAALLGTKIQYGGLNNLLAAGSVSKLHTVNWGVFTGLSVGF